MESWLVKRRRQRVLSITHGMVLQALLQGQLQRPEACEFCGSAEYVPNAHHDDYREPLRVRWLCPGCHKRFHVEHGPGLGIPELIEEFWGSDV